MHTPCGEGFTTIVNQPLHAIVHISIQQWKHYAIHTSANCVTVGVANRVKVGIVNCAATVGVVRSTSSLNIIRAIVPPVSMDFALHYTRDYLSVCHIKLHPPTLPPLSLCSRFF